MGAGRVGHGRGKGLVQQDSVYPVVGGLRERSGNSEGVRLLYTEIQLRKKKHQHVRNRYIFRCVIRCLGVWYHCALHERFGSSMRSDS